MCELANFSAGAFEPFSVSEMGFITGDTAVPTVRPALRIEGTYGKNLWMSPKDKYKSFRVRNSIRENVVID